MKISVPPDQHLSSLGKPCDANWWSSGPSSRGISICHHSASLVIQIGDPLDGFHECGSDRKIRPKDHRFASRGMPSDDKCWSRGYTSLCCLRHTGSHFAYYPNESEIFGILVILESPNINRNIYKHCRPRCNATSESAMFTMIKTIFRDRNWI